MRTSIDKKETGVQIIKLNLSSRTIQSPLLPVLSPKSVSYRFPDSDLCSRDYNSDTEIIGN
jgi:hypothetical protein